MLGQAFHFPEVVQPVVFQLAGLYSGGLKIFSPAQFVCYFAFAFVSSDFI